MNVRSAISKINKNGALLVFPHNNRPEPNSLWKEFFPRKKLRWEWNEDGDNSVFDLWALMKRLSDNKKVVYSKWHQGRATFFSRELFKAMLCIYRQQGSLEAGLNFESRDLLEILEQDSPLSTKDLKSMAGLQGKYNASLYNRGMRDLFRRLLIVGYGEVDDGAFPSLAIGSTKLLYEDLWRDSVEITANRAQEIIDQYMPKGSVFRKSYDKTLKDLQRLAETEPDL